MKINQAIVVVFVLGLGCSSASDRPLSSPGTRVAGKVETGSPPPELALADGGGDIVGLDKFSGKVVLIDFWASWCAPCKEELPVLEELYRRYKSKGLVIVGVNIDEDRKAADGFLEQTPVSFPILYDPEQKAAQDWDPPKMPTSYAIGRDGKIAFVQAGFEASEAAQLESRLVDLLDR